VPLLISLLCPLFISHGRHFELKESSLVQDWPWIQVAVQLLEYFLDLRKFRCSLSTDRLNFYRHVILDYLLQLQVVHASPIVFNLEIHLAFRCVVPNTDLDTAPLGKLEAKLHQKENYLVHSTSFAPHHQIFVKSDHRSNFYFLELRPSWVNDINYSHNSFKRVEILSLFV